MLNEEFKYFRCFQKNTSFHRNNWMSECYNLHKFLMTKDGKNDKIVIKKAEKERNNVNNKNQCKECNKETIYQNYCMPCTFDLKEELEKDEKIKINGNEQLIMFVFKTINGQNKNDLKDLIEQLQKETSSDKSEIEQKVNRLFQIKDVYSLLKDLGQEKNISRLKKNDYCAVCKTEQNFYEEPIVGCSHCAEELEEILKKEQLMLLEEDKLKYKRLAYLHTDFYKGKGVIKERSEELSYMWFGKIYSEEEINKEMEKYEKENKHPLRQLKNNVIKIKQEKEKIKTPKCNICQTETEDREMLTGEEHFLCLGCSNKIKEKAEGKMLNEQSHEYKNIIMHCYIKKLFEANRMTPEFYAYLKENDDVLRLNINSLEDLKMKNKTFISNLENVKEKIVFNVTGKKKKEKIIGLGNLKKHIKEVKDFEEWQRKRREEGLKTINQNLSAFFIGKKGTGSSTGISYYREEMIKDGLIEDKPLISLTRALLDDPIALNTIESKTKEAKNTFVVLENASEFIATTKGRKILDYISEKMNNENVHFILKTEEKNKAKTINKYMNYKITKQIYFEEYKEKEFVELFDRIVEENDYVLSNYARTVLKEHIKESKRTKTYANYLFEKMIQNMVKREVNRKEPNMKLLTKEDMKKAIS